MAKAEGLLAKLNGMYPLAAVSRQLPPSRCSVHSHRANASKRHSRSDSVQRAAHKRFCTLVLLPAGTIYRGTPKHSCVVCVQCPSRASGQALRTHGWTELVSSISWAYRLWLNIHRLSTPTHHAPKGLASLPVAKARGLTLEVKSRARPELGVKIISTTYEQM